MKIATIFVFSIFQSSFSQNYKEAEKNLKLGESAYQNKDYVSAKNYFDAALKLDSINKNIWYNLAATQLMLNDTNSACESFYRTYKLGDNEALDYLKKYCAEFGKESFTSLEKVDQQLQFKFKEEVFPLIVNNNLNPKYLKIVTKEVENILGFLKSNQNGTLLVRVEINKKGEFIGKVGIIKSNLSESDIQKIIQETQQKLAKIVEYIPATYKGRNVELWEKWILPINF